MLDRLTTLSLFRDLRAVVGRETRLLLARFRISRLGRGNSEFADSSVSPQLLILRTLSLVLNRKWGVWGRRRS